MGVWSPAFQHRFLDGNLLNFSAAPGLEPAISFEVPVVRPTPPADQRGFPVRRGNRFNYKFKPGLFTGVIGADLKLDLAFPAAPAGAQLSGNVALASGIRLTLGFVDDNARIQLFVGNDVMAASARFDPSGPLRLQARWHTHGQGQIWIDGSLRSYHPALAPGQSFTIEQLAFGHHDTSGTASSAPAFLIRRIGVKMLRDIDARRCLDGLFPIAEPTPLQPDCRRRLANAQAVVLAEIRQFMQQAVARLSSTWQDGQPGGPFSPEAVAAHAAAVAAGGAFVAFMLHHPGGDPDLVIQKLDEFLTLVRATDPAAYDQAIARLQGMSQPFDPNCLAQLQPLVQTHGDRLRPTVDLLEALWAKMQSPGVTP
jgi:hypothetical protein